MAGEIKGYRCCTDGISSEMLLGVLASVLVRKNVCCTFFSQLNQLLLRFLICVL